MGSTWKEELHILCLFTLFKEGRSGGNHFSMILKKKAMRSEGDALSVALGEFGKRNDQEFEEEFEAFTWNHSCTSPPTG